MSDSTVKYLKPFLASAKNVLETMAQVKMTGQKSSVDTDRKTVGALTAIIPIKGENISGNVLFSFSDKTILGIVGKMLMEEIAEINQDVVDTTLEIMNMVSGSASNALAGDGLGVTLESPIVIQGEGEVIEQLTKARLITIPFETEAGSFVVQTDLIDT